MIRKAKPDDVPAIVELAVKSVSINPLPLKIDREAMREQAMQCLQPAHFLYVSEIDGVIVGALAAVVLPGFWHEKCACSVLLHFSTQPGQWVRLVKVFADWVKSRSTIKVAVFELEPETPEKVVHFLQRLGFTRRSQNVSFVRQAL